MTAAIDQPVIYNPNAAGFRVIPAGAQLLSANVANQGLCVVLDRAGPNTIT